MGAGRRAWLQEGKEAQGLAANPVLEEQLLPAHLPSEGAASVGCGAAGKPVCRRVEAVWQRNIGKNGVANCAVLL